MDWYVYILRCSDNSLYTGITNNIDRRVAQHNGHGNQGAKYTRHRAPSVVVYTEKHADRSSASIRESEIKALSKKEKEAIVSGFILKA